MTFCNSVDVIKQVGEQAAVGKCETGGELMVPLRNRSLT